MQYLDSFDGKLDFIDETEWVFLDLWSLTDYLEGVPNKDQKTLAKYLNLDGIFQENDNPGVRYHNCNTTGVGMRFATDSPSIIIKAQIKRPYSYQNVTLCCTHGFDIYVVNSYGASHMTVVAPDEPYSVFAHEINLHQHNVVQIYFPTYNDVINFSLGVKAGCCLSVAPSRNNSDVVCFYGNSRTQGASASRSGNIFPNIVSRKLNTEIHNYSFSTGCRAEVSAAQQIIDNLSRQGRKMSAFILDYTANAMNLEEFSQRLYPFYKTIRDAYPNIPIVIINAFCAPYFDRHIKEVFSKVQKAGENTFFIDLKELFGGLDLIALTVDRMHYTDVGMFLVADKICEYIKQGSPMFK